jgi:uncharacterized membrane protein YbhN (UPF0104 family)
MAAGWPERGTAYARPAPEPVTPKPDVAEPAAEPTSVTEPAAADGQRPKRRNWFRRHWQLCLTVLMLGVAYLTLRNHLPSIHAVGAALTSANVRWIVLAAACEVLSLAMFAWQQQRLLSATGVRMSFRRANAVTYARSALAISMPAGSAVSAGFAFQQYRRSGATNDKAAAVMVLSGVVSFLGLAALYVAGTLALLAAQPAKTIHNHPVPLITLGCLVVLGGVAWLVRHRIARRRPPKPAPSMPADGTWVDRIVVTARQALAAWRALRVRDWMAACSFAVANWLLDLLCLICSAKAFALPVGLFTIVTLYLGVQIVRQLPITPGGIGLIETGLLAGLTHAGASAGAAAAAVLTYRMMSCWLIIPLGGVAWLGLRARPATGPDGSEPTASGAAEPATTGQTG